LRSARAGRSPPALLPEVVVSAEPPAPIVLLLPVLPVPEAPMDVPELPLPLVDESVLAVLPVVPLVEPEVPLLVLGEALGVVALLPAPGVGVVTPPVDELDPEVPEPAEPAAPDEPDEPEPAPPAPPEPWAIDRPPIARAAAAAKAVRVFLVVIMTYSLSGNPEGGG
jgi:hypothetical protein